MIRSTSILSAAVLAFASSAALAGINISSGTTGSQSVFQQPGGGSGSPFQVGTSGNGTYVTNGAPFASNNPDHLFYYNWFYQRPAGSNRAFGFVDTPTELNAGNTSTITYTNAGDTSSGGNGRLDAVFTFVLTDGAQPGASRLDVTTVFRANAGNTSAGTFDFTNVVDLDLNASATNDIHNATFANGTFVATVTDTEAAATKQALRAIITANGVTRVQLGSGTSLRSLGGTTTDLNNTITQFSGDGAAAFQYVLTLAPGESQTFTSSIEFVPVPEPTTLAALALAMPALGRRRRV